MTNMVPIYNVQNPMIPDRTTLHADFDQAELEFNERYASVSVGIESHETEAVFKLMELVPDASMAKLAFGATDGAAVKEVSGRRNALLLATMVGKIALVGAVLAAIIVALVFAIDFAALYRLFAGEFENRFGEVTAVGVVALLALQGLAAAMIFKVFIGSSEKRQAYVIWGTTFLAMIYGVGLVLDSGFKKTAALVAETQTRIGWNVPATTSNAVEPEGLEYLTVFALGLPYLLLPLAGGVFAALAVRGFVTWAKSRAEWRHFSDGYGEMKTAIKGTSQGRNQLAQIEAQHQSSIRQHGNKRIAKKLFEANEVIELCSKAQMTGAKRIVLPGTGGAIVDIPYAMKIATEARDVLGSGYLDREIEIWQQQRLEAANKWKGLSS